MWFSAQGAFAGGQAVAVQEVAQLGGTRGGVGEVLAFGDVVVDAVLLGSTS